MLSQLVPFQSLCPRSVLPSRATNSKDAVNPDRLKKVDRIFTRIMPLYLAILRSDSPLIPTNWLTSRIAHCFSTPLCLGWKPICSMLCFCAPTQCTKMRSARAAQAAQAAMHMASAKPSLKLNSGMWAWSPGRGFYTFFADIECKKSRASSITSLVSP